MATFKFVVLALVAACACSSAPSYPLRPFPFHRLCEPPLYISAGTGLSARQLTWVRVLLPPHGRDNPCTLADDSINFSVCRQQMLNVNVCMTASMLLRLDAMRCDVTGERKFLVLSHGRDLLVSTLDLAERT